MAALLAALAALALLADEAVGGEILAARTLRAGSVVQAGDLVVDAPADQRADLIAPLLGLEARRAIYRGRPVAATDLGPPTLVERNAIVRMIYHEGALAIRTEGRALDAGGAGERIRVMNLDSRLSVRATIVGPDRVEVGP